MLAPYQRWVWASVTNRGPTLTQRWIKASCLFHYATSAHHWHGNVSVYRTLFRCRAIVYDAGQHVNGIGAVCVLTAASRRHCPVLYECWPALPTVDQRWTDIGLELFWLVIDTNISWKLWWTLNKSQITARKHLIQFLNKHYNHPWMSKLCVYSGWLEIAIWSGAIWSFIESDHSWRLTVW